MIRTQNISQIFYQADSIFEEKALAFFQHQAVYSCFYSKYVQALSKEADSVRNLSQIPFLPVRFFKHHEIITHEIEMNAGAEKLLFESSGTTGQINSKHHVQDSRLYEISFTACFEQFYGHAEDYCVLGLLPSYLERGHSSLVYMVDSLIKKSGHPLSNFYLYNHDALYQHLKALEASGQKTILIGVTYALLDFAEKYPLDLHHTTIIETGGMKGRREEMLREEVHQILKNRFKIPAVHAEYGMTELLSQAYSKENGLFQCPPWMRVLVRDVSDPFQISTTGKGVLNIIDLANIHSCCFIATDDIGEVFPDGTFSVMGRLDNSDLRGCSLMYEN